MCSVLLALASAWDRIALADYGIMQSSIFEQQILVLIYNGVCYLLMLLTFLNFVFWHIQGMQVRIVLRMMLMSTQQVGFACTHQHRIVFYCSSICEEICYANVPISAY